MWKSKHPSRKIRLFGGQFMNWRTLTRIATSICSFTFAISITRRITSTPLTLSMINDTGPQD